MQICLLEVLFVALSQLSKYVFCLETNSAENHEDNVFSQESLTAKPLQPHKLTTKPQLFNMLSFFQLRCLSSCVPFQNFNPLRSGDLLVSMESRRK